MAYTQVIFSGGASTNVYLASDTHGNMYSFYYMNLMSNSESFIQEQIFLCCAVYIWQELYC